MACRLALILLAFNSAAHAAIRERIGTWVLTCPGRGAATEACQLRLDKRLFDKAGITGDLEIQASGGVLVPVLALRGLPAEVLMTAALAGRVEAAMRLGDEPLVHLGCASSSGAYLCWPRDNGARALGTALASARKITVQITVTVAGMKPLPVPEKSLELSHTGEALARLRAVGPPSVPGPMAALVSQTPDGLAAIADKALKAAGYPRGTGDLRTLLGEYLGR